MVDYYVICLQVPPLFLRCAFYLIISVADSPWVGQTCATRGKFREPSHKLTRVDQSNTDPLIDLANQIPWNSEFLFSRIGQHGQTIMKSISLLSATFVVFFFLSLEPVEGGVISGTFRTLTNFIFWRTNKPVSKTLYETLSDNFKTFAKRTNENNSIQFVETAETYYNEFGALPLGDAQRDEEVIAAMNQYLVETSLLLAETAKAKKISRNTKGHIASNFDKGVKYLEAIKNKILDLASAKVLAYDQGTKFSQMPDISNPKKFIATNGPWFALIPLVERADAMRKYACLHVYQNSQCKGQKPYGSQFSPELQTTLTTCVGNLRKFIEGVQEWMQHTSAKSKNKNLRDQQHWFHTLPHITAMWRRLDKTIRLMSATTTEIARKETLRRKLKRYITGQ